MKPHAKRLARIVAIAALASTGALAAESAAPFLFSPEPRWHLAAGDEPDTREVCAAVRKECPAITNLADIRAEFGFDQIHDVDGQLVGLRMTRSTGCKPLDEDLLISQRKFRMAFHHPGESDLDDGIHAEVAAGVPRDAVRIVKPKHTELSLDCSPG